MSLREQLAKKRARSASFFFPLDEEGASALARWAELEQAALFAYGIGKSPDEARAQQEELRPSIREHCAEIRFRGLTEEERDALVSAHTVPEDDPAVLAKDPKATKTDRLPFVCDALAATVLSEDNLTAEEWRAELLSDRWTAGDRSALFERIVRTTGEQPALSIPFD